MVPPNSFFRIKTLYDLQTYGIYFTGTFPDCDQTDLEQISLCDSYLVGTLPSSVCNLIHLGSLLIGGNYFISLLANMSTMIYFNISSNQLTGTLSENLCGMYNTAVFFVANYNRLQGSIPAFLGDFRALQYLFLSFNELTGSLLFLRYEYGASQLNKLSVKHNQLTGAIFEDLG